VLPYHVSSSDQRGSVARARAVMSLAAKFNIVITTGTLGLIWIIYAATRSQRISSALLFDQIGMASLLLSVLIFVSNFSGLFDQ
jgi:hypothetical protein